MDCWIRDEISSYYLSIAHYAILLCYCIEANIITKGTISASSSTIYCALLLRTSDESIRAGQIIQFSGHAEGRIKFPSVVRKMLIKLTGATKPCCIGHDMRPRLAIKECGPS